MPNETQARMKCRVEACQTSARARGLCPRHYGQVRKNGRLTNEGANYRSPNEVRIDGDLAVMTLFGKDGAAKGVALLDAECLPLVTPFKWHLASTGYAATRGKAGSAYMHRIVCPGGEHTDHINGDKLDNRRANLRAVDAYINLANSGAKRTSKTGVRGVHQNHRGKFVAQLTVKRKTVHIGTFSTMAEASEAYEAARVAAGVAPPCRDKYKLWSK